jgi:hypothetical protein
MAQPWTFMMMMMMMMMIMINPNKMHMLQILFYLTYALHVSGVTITHLQEHKTTVTTASGNRYTVIAKVKFTDKEYLSIRLKSQLLLLLLIMYILRKMQYVL